MSLDGNNKDIFREGVIKQTFHFTTMTFQISHLIAFLNIWYKGQILYLTINKAETHAATFLLVSIFSFLAAWHTRPADYICKMAKFFSRLGITCLAGGARLLDQGGGHKKLLHSLSPGWPPYSAGVHVSCTVYSVLYTPLSPLLARGWLYCAELLLAIRVKHIPAAAPQPHWAQRVSALASSN